MHGLRVREIHARPTLTTLSFFENVYADVERRHVLLAEMTGLHAQTEHQCVHLKRGFLASLWDPAPLAAPPLRGFSGDGAICRRN